MSFSKRMSVGLLSIIFLVALVSAIPVDAKKGFSAYRWYTHAYYTGYPVGDLEDPEWTGDIWTEDGEHGTIIWDNFDAIFLGPEGDKAQKFWGIWWIEWDDGDYIEGTHDGSFTYAIMQFTINGHITVATGDWSFLLGRKMHTVGIADLSVFPPSNDAYIQIN